MNQRVFLGGRPTLLDVAKSAVETFVKVSCLLLSDFFLIIEVPRVRFLHTYKYLHVQFYDMQYAVYAHVNNHCRVGSHKFSYKITLINFPLFTLQKCMCYIHIHIK